MFIARRHALVTKAPAGRQVIAGHGRYYSTQGRNDARENRKPENREETLPYLAPEGRHVYSTRHAPNTKAPEGRQVPFVSITD